MNLKNKKVGAIFHDAGSANLGIAFLKKKKIKTHFYCAGPALKIMKSYNKNFTNKNRPSSIINNSEIVITGTSRINNIEYSVRKICKKKNITNITIIDHWTGYLKRFKKGKELILPNYLFVFNKQSFLMAKKIFNGKLVVKKFQNYFEQKILENIKKKKKNSLNLLYVLEPFDGKFEFDALNRFKIAILKFNLKFNIIFKLHPSEKINKYSNWIKKNKNLNIKLVNEASISNTLSWADYVVGLESYLLVLAMKSKKKVYTLLPLNGKKFRLPFNKILNINKFK